MTNQTPNFYALLIGIDFYFPYTSPEGTYKNLQGCVRDINHVETYLKDTFNLTPNQIFKLTASASENPQQPKEPPELLPTYKNIVAKFQEVTAIAQPQDQVYIHYSGHGGRAKTIYENLKGAFGLDEGLVPTDIGLPNSRYLRDLELAKLLEEMVAKGLVVTIVLDSCHSGGATREMSDDRVRGCTFTDNTPRPTDSLVASVDKLIQNWQTLSVNSRNIKVVNGLLPEPKGYTLIAACRDNELAYEDVFEGTERNGALTYFLLQELRKSGREVGAKVLFDRISNLVHNRFNRQTPMLLGETNKTFFSGQSVNVYSSGLVRSVPSDSYASRSIAVRQVDISKNRVKLQTGEANGVNKGAEFEIFPFGTINFNQAENRIATVKVVEVGASDCWAELTDLGLDNAVRGPAILMEGTIEEGFPAIPLSSGIKQIRKVRLILPSVLPKIPNVNVALLPAIFPSTKQRVEGHRWIEFCSEETEDEEVDYFVSLTPEGEYIILNADKEPIKYFLYPVKADEPKAIKKVIDRLIHFAKYQATLDLDNEDFTAPLNGKLKVELIKSVKRRPVILNAEGKVPVLSVGELIHLLITNESNRTLNITVLFLQADLSIVQYYPKGAPYDIVEPGQQIKVTLELELPENYQEGEDIIKVFATLDGTNFQILELPALDQSRKGFGNQQPKNVLEQLLSAVVDENNPQRNIKVVTYAYEEWTTEQVKLIVKKNID
ncbi:caspase family protein [Aerosakkonemataceae cyanobacterium BLCC-F50]|uniref:Caspase family protein n=1 Tax=Floridaenema flaviceps BLCC-F50 TaxID=3153642 RepID=A0ABV4XVB4_9CYAN